MYILNLYLILVAARVLLESGDISKHDVEEILMQMCKDFEEATNFTLWINTTAYFDDVNIYCPLNQHGVPEFRYGVLQVDVGTDEMVDASSRENFLLFDYDMEE